MKRLSQLKNEQAETNNLLKHIFTSLEYNRLNPENKLNVKDIIEKEREGEKLTEELAGITPKIVFYFGMGLYVIGTIVFTYIFVSNWDYVSNFDIVDFIKNVIIRYKKL